MYMKGEIPDDCSCAISIHQCKRILENVKGRTMDENTDWVQEFLQDAEKQINIKHKLDLEKYINNIKNKNNYSNKWNRIYKK